MVLRRMLLSVQKTKDMLILEKEMEEVSGNYYPCTDDGSYGHADGYYYGRRVGKKEINMTSVLQSDR